MSEIPLPEIEIQKWILGLIDGKSGSSGLSFPDVIRYSNDSLSQEMKVSVEEPYGPRTISLAAHRAAHHACRILRGLVEPRLISADGNISLIPGQVLRPDVLLEDQNSGAYMILEIKRSKRTAREFATELLAYANSLTKNYRSLKIFIVPISSSWATLETEAVTKLSKLGFPVLPLEYRERLSAEEGPTLWVRSDLLPSNQNSAIHRDAFMLTSKVFKVEGVNRSNWIYLRAKNRLINMGELIVHEARLSNSTGFLLIWHQYKSYSGYPTDLGVLRVFYTVAIQMPCDLVDQNSFDELTDDTAERLLLDLHLGADFQSDGSECEGTWHQLESRMENEPARVLYFQGFGELAERVQKWRGEDRSYLSPMIKDVTFFPTYNPVTWLPALESMMNREDSDVQAPSQRYAFQLGRALIGLMSGNCKAENNYFEYMLSEVRCAESWRFFFLDDRNAPVPVFLVSPLCSQWFKTSLRNALDFSHQHFESIGGVENFCFQLGVNIKSGRNLEKMIEMHSNILRAGGFITETIDREFGRLISKCGLV